jgi:hypothetical protein
VVVTTEPAEPNRRRIYWWLAWAAVVVAVVAVTLMLTTGHAGGGDNEAAEATTGKKTATSTASGGAYDLSSPTAAATSFAAAAATNDGEALLTLACVGHVACVDEQGLDAAKLADARAVISENAFELADHLKGAEFAPAVDGAVPGTKDVPYRTPAMADGTTLTLTFVQSGDDWLYLGPAT